jgi:pimeloyl-ACP methyl ester carboxylesterase
VLLVHSINAAAGAHEMRPLTDRLAHRHTVYVPDLPGFGGSARRDIVYTPRLYTDALHAVNAAIRQAHGPSPLPALALSLGCEFLARAAVERPDEWGPPGAGQPHRPDGHQGPPRAAGATRAVPGLHAVLAAPWWGPALFRQLTKPSAWCATSCAAPGVATGSTRRCGPTPWPRRSAPGRPPRPAVLL